LNLIYKDISLLIHCKMFKTMNNLKMIVSRFSIVPNCGSAMNIQRLQTCASFSYDLPKSFTSTASSFIPVAYTGKHQCKNYSCYQNINSRSFSSSKASLSDDQSSEQSQVSKLENMQLKLYQYPTCPFCCKAIVYATSWYSF